MDTHSRGQEDNLSEVERRLAGWQPAATGLDADALLFAAGRAAGRRGPARFIWPGLSVCLAALATFLGLWGASERSERLAQVQQFQQRRPLPPALPPTPVLAEPTTDDAAAPNSVLAAYRALEQGLESWPPAPVPRTDSPGPPLPDSPTLRVGQPDSLPDL